jgi:hypothetical protein
MQLWKKITIYRSILLLLLMFPFFGSAQNSSDITVSGMIRDVKKIVVPYMNIVFKTAKDSSFVIVRSRSPLPWGVLIDGKQMARTCSIH